MKWTLERCWLLFVATSLFTTMLRVFQACSWCTSGARWSKPTARRRHCRARPPAPPRSRRWREFQVEDRDQDFGALRSTRIARQNCRSKVSAFPAVAGTIANSGITHGHRSDAGHGLALGQMAVTHRRARPSQVCRSTYWLRNVATSASIAWNRSGSRRRVDAA